MRVRARRTSILAVLVGACAAAMAVPALAAVLAISGLSARSGHVGSTVTISGSGFTGATSVQFHGTPSTFSVKSDSQIVATIPGGPDTTGKISVTTPAGTALSPYSFKVKPTSLKISKFAPTTGPAGTSVVITGSDFTGAKSVTFAGTAAAFTVNSDTQITATVPAGAASGRIVVVVPTSSVTSSARFVVIVPRIASFTPDTAPVGASIVLKGAGFTGATSVLFHGTPAVTFTVNSDKQITVTVPAGAASGKLTVVTPLGTIVTKARFLIS